MTKGASATAEAGGGTPAVHTDGEADSGSMSHVDVLRRNRYVALPPVGLARRKKQPLEGSATKLRTPPMGRFAFR
jgi:hypothetical protein